MEVARVEADQTRQRRAGIVSYQFVVFLFLYDDISNCSVDFFFLVSPHSVFSFV